MITSNNCENSSNRKLEEGRATFAAFSFSTAVKSLKRESVDGIISKDVNASLSTLFEKNRQDVIFIMQFCCQLHVGIKDITYSATLL